MMDADAGNADAGALAAGTPAPGGGLGRRLQTKTSIREAGDMEVGMDVGKGTVGAGDGLGWADGRACGADRGAIALLNATVLDGTLGRDGSMARRPGSAVVIEGRTIAYVGPCEHVRIPDGATMVDLDGAFLMPGLINMHAHLIGTGDETGACDEDGDPLGQDDRMRACMDDEDRLCRYMREAALAQLCGGVTTVRDAGEAFSADVWLRDAIASGEVVGPRVIAAGNGITVPEGHACGLLSRVAHTPGEARLYVRDFKEMGVDVIKLFVTGGVLDAKRAGEPGMLRMSPRITEAACDEAHGLGLPVMAHVESTEGVLSALECGVDTIEHGAPMTDEIAELYRCRGAAVTCTISPTLPLVAITGRGQEGLSEAQEMLVGNARVVARGVIESARTALDRGILVGLGTDSSCPYVTQYDMWRELDYFVRYVGVTPDFALHTATQVNAQILGLADITGTVEAGKEADLIVTREDPLRDVSALRRLEMVVARGQLVDDPQSRLRRLPKIDEALDWMNAREISL